MNRIHYRHHFRRTAAVLGALAGSVLVVLTGTTAAFAYAVPPPGGPAGPVQLPRVHTVVAGGMPGWQIALIAIGAALVAALVAVLAYRAWTARRQPLAAPRFGSPAQVAGGK